MCAFANWLVPAHVSVLEVKGRGKEQEKDEEMEEGTGIKTKEASSGTKGNQSKGPEKEE